jgi:hypothetical protein
VKLSKKADLEQGGRGMELNIPQETQRLRAQRNCSKHIKLVTEGPVPSRLQRWRAVVYVVFSKSSKSYCCEDLCTTSVAPIEQIITQVSAYHFPCWCLCREYRGLLLLLGHRLCGSTSVSYSL